MATLADTSPMAPVDAGTTIDQPAVGNRLATLDFVEAFHDADHTGGGWGATVVRLKDEG